MKDIIFRDLLSPSTHRGRARRPRTSGFRRPFGRDQQRGRGRLPEMSGFSNLAARGQGQAFPTRNAGGYFPRCTGRGLCVRRPSAAGRAPTDLPGDVHKPRGKNLRLSAASGPGNGADITGAIDLQEQQFSRVALSGRKMAYQGVAGAFCEEAAMQALPDWETLPCEGFETVFQVNSFVSLMMAFRRGDGSYAPSTVLADVQGCRTRQFPLSSFRRPSAQRRAPISASLRA